ncbi:unnamed protein product [Chironomus riparius]|uniref:SAC3/GANP/THP3 conserved domain-containing protein n=1 Tax=Chironomus riparius TaxID=315576 RepID=A0A9N9RSZ8_9DIPT|nr:unnamed protein product [Chironomus riparius]
MEGDIPAENKSITCFKLPDLFILDKQETKKFFSQYGSIKSFILKPKRAECTIEYHFVEDAMKALNADVDFDVVPTKPEYLKVSDDYIDPDVQTELQAMLPSSMKTSKPSVESLMKHPFKSKMFLQSPKHKTEPISVAVHSDPRLIQNAKMELDNLTRKPAVTAEEKFAILDVRDKLYRVINAKPSDIKSVTSTRGTCKDMCPEKERLMRVARLQVASFELNDETNTMDPNKAIKQYSRSSADQEIPLPHELRSEEVLKTTMTYLLHNIINLCDDEDVSVGDWYHFVWDRTRGIRKDITQQELCSLTTVELLEQCARFHIHCSARLIAEDPGIFSEKINDENLTKSLQTLKYMYDDLKAKNIKCPNEAEFRAYVVLLNLNESGNFLWEIKRLEKDILNSQEVRFALDVYFAVALNNYVKFFNLVREASYMNSCILLKYFTQIRLRAIFTIMRAYTQRRGAKISFNLSYLTEILNFENYESTANFMSYYGGLCELDADIVNLDPGTFANVTVPYQMERALETVECKLDGTIAEAICGGDLPSPSCFLKIKPHSSFDDIGYLKKEAYYAEDQNGTSINKDSLFKVPKESPPVSPAAKLWNSGSVQQKNVFKNDQIDSGIFGTVPFTKTAKSTNYDNPFGIANIPKPKANVFNSPNIFGTEFTNTPNTNMKISNIFGTSSGKNIDMFKTTSAETVKIPTIDPYMFAKPIAMEESPRSTTSGSPYSTNSNSSSGLTSDQEAVIRDDKHRIEAERIRKENEVAEMILRKKLAEKAKHEHEKREAHERMERQKRQEEERRKREIEKQKQNKLQEDAEKILNSLLDELVTSKVKTEATMADILYVKIPNDFYDAMEFDIVVEELIQISRQELLCYYNSTKRKYDALYRNFDHWRKISFKEKQRREKLSNIGCTSLNKSLEDHANSILHPQQNATLSNMKQYLTGSPQQVIVPNLDTYNPINLFTDLDIPLKKLPSKLFWKIVVSIPLKNEEKSVGFSCFIKKYLKKIFNAHEDGNIFLLKHSVVHHSKVSICVRKIQGIECLDEQMERQSNVIENTNSLVFFCTTANLNESRRRLNNILDKVNNSVSVSIIIYKNVIESTDEIMIQKYFDLSMEPKVKNFEVNLFYECREKSKDLRQVLIEGCQFLYDNYSQQLSTEYSDLYDLEMQHLLDFFQFYFGDEMWHKIEFSCRDSKDFSNRMSSFNNVIQIYNSCIDTIIGIISTNYKNLPTLPEEFRTSLPNMEVRIPHSFEYFPANWKQLLQQKSLISFLHDLKLIKMQNDKFKNFKDFQEKLLKFLDINISSTFKMQVYHAVLDKIVQNFYLMQLKSSEKIDNAIDKMRWLKIFESIVVGKFNEVYQQKHSNLPKFIIYSKKDMQNYMIPWWYLIGLTVTDENQNEPSNKKPKLMQKIDKNEMQSVLKKGLDSLKKATDIVNNSRENTTKTRVESKSFDQYLNKCEEQFRGMKRSLQSMQDKFKDNK